MQKYLSKIIEYGFYLLLFILPWQTRWIIKAGDINGLFFEYGTYSLYASDILLIGLLVLSGFYFYLKKPNLAKLKYQNIWLALLLIDVAALISIYFAEDRYLAVYRYINFLMGIFLFTLIIYFPYKKSKALVSYFSALLIQSILAIWQFINQISPANKWLGLAEHIPYNHGVSVVEAMGNIGFVERWMRSYGSLPHPNILGGILVMGLIIFIFLSVRKNKEIRLEDNEDSRREIFKVNLVTYSAVLIVSAAILFSFSRSAWLAGIIGIFSFLLIIAFLKDKVQQKYLLPIILYTSIIIFILSIPFGNLLNARIKSNNRLEKISITEHMSSVNTAKEVLQDKWLFGTGIGNYTIVLKKDYTENEEPAYFYQPVHNTFLLIWSEIGLLGIFGFILLIVMIFLESRSRAMLQYKFPLLIAFIVLLFFDHWSWSLHFGFLYLCLILGFCLKLFELDTETDNVV